MERALGPTIPVEDLLRHARWLRRLAAELVRDPARADDLVQETWLAALRRPPRADAAPRPWLARVLRNLARNARRSERARGEHEARASEPPRGAGPDAIAEELEMQRVLAEVVGRLAEPARTIVVLRYFRGLDSRAIGRELALPAGTVRWKLKEAVEELRRALDRRVEGGRRAWSLVLLRLLAAPAPAGVATTSWFTVAGAVAVLGALAWNARRTSDGGADGRVDAPSIATSSEEPTLARVELAPAAAAPSAVPVALPSTARVPLATVAPPRPREDAPDIAGIVLVDGAPPERTLSLRLQLASSAGAALQARRHSTDDAGRFEVHAVGAERGFTLAVPGFLVEGDVGGDIRPLRRTPELVTPALGLVLRLRTPPAVRGRVVDADGRPVGAAHGVLQARAEASGWTLEPSPRQFDCDDEGMFAVPLVDLVDPSWPTLGAGDPCTATLLLELPRVGRAVRETGRFVFADFDVGDVVLEPVRALRFRVLDEDGAPLAGAVARVDDSGGTCPSDPTNRDGRGELRWLPERNVRVRFSALGRADTVLALGPLDEPEVLLAPVCVLDVKLEAPAGDEQPLPELVLTADEELFVSSDAPRRLMASDPDPIQVEFGAASCVGWSSSGGAAGTRVVARFRADAGGRALISAVRPGIHVVVEACDPAGIVLARRELVTRAGEQRFVLPYGAPGAR